MALVNTASRRRISAELPVLLPSIMNNSETPWTKCVFQSLCTEHMFICYRRRNSNFHRLLIASLVPSLLVMVWC